MATTAVGSSLPTLADLIKRKDPNGAQARVVEMLSRLNPVLEDAVFKEGNLETGERITSRTALPAVGSGLAWRKFNEGVAAGKSRTAQLDETCGMLNGLSKVDKSLADLNGDPAAFRASEDMAFLQGLNNEVENGFFYHSVKATPEKFMGFSPRLDATSGNPASSQIIKHTAGAAGSDQTSIWFIVWGPDTVYGIFPKGSIGGLSHNDMGVEMVRDANNNEYPAYRTWWEWKVGACVRDWRYLVRLCNIDNSALSATNDDLIPAMIDAYYQLQDTKMGRLVVYCNRFVAKFLQKQARNAVKNSQLSIENVEGKRILTFMDAPVRVADALVNTESVIS